MQDIDPGMLPTERDANGISIRKYQPADAAGIVEAAQESIATVGTWTDWCTPQYANADAEAWVGHAIGAWDGAESFHFAIVDATSGDYLGGVGVVPGKTVDDPAVLGYWIRQTYQGRGVGTQAARLAVGFAFELLKITRIEIVCGAANRPSRRVAEKTGARYEGLKSGRLTLHGKPMDAALYSLSTPSARKS